MTTMADGPVTAAPTQVPALDCEPHAWSLRDVEYDEGLSLNRFECLDCGAVRYT